MPHSDHSSGVAPEPQSWVLRSAGPYGADVEVVSAEAYQRLAQRCRNAEASALLWGRRCLELEGKSVSKIKSWDVLDGLRILLAQEQAAPDDKRLRTEDDHG